MATAAHDEGFLPAAARNEWMRQVHLVRKQEFAYLRSVQKRETGAAFEPTLAGLPARASAAVQVRGDTLKKIDEIEAQLDLLWVASRGKRTDSVFPFGSAFAAEGLGSEGAARGSAETASTLQAAPGVLTQMMHHTEMPSSVLLVATMDDVPAPLTQFTAMAPAVDGPGPATALAPKPGRKQPAMPLDKAPQYADTVLQTAATLFACAEYDLAAQHLLRVLRGKPARGVQALQRLLALLEIYRATGNQAQFDWSVLEYFDYWDGRTPQWTSPADAPLASQQVRQSPRVRDANPAASRQDAARAWRCPSVLDRAAAQALGTHWQSQRDCSIDWTSLSVVQADAAKALTALLMSPQGAPDQVVFQDTPNLLYVLEHATPQGQAHTERSLWDLRFCMLQLMRMRAAFDAATTDFCLTYIEAPPQWQEATVRFVDAAVVAHAPVHTPAAGATPWQLHGHVEGASGLQLPELTELPEIPEPPLETGSGSWPPHISIACATLVRMDPQACTQLLQWLQRAHAQKATLHLRDVSLLVGAGWAAAGVDRYAQVHLRDLP